MRRIILTCFMTLMSIMAIADKSGKCGDNLTWSLADTGVLTITGTGPMWDYEDKSPWYLEQPIFQVSISEGVTSVGDYAFYGCDKLKTITLPNSLTSIGRNAFSHSGITRITIPNGVKEIPFGSFSYCKSLKEIKIPNSVVTIGADAFLDCTSLNEVTIGYNVSTIGSCAFSYCTNLYYVTCYATNPPTIYDDTFCAQMTEEGRLFVPRGSESDYAGARYWKDMPEIITVNPLCHTPVLKYQDGRITATCDTPGAEIYYRYQTEDFTISGSGSEVSMDVPLTVTVTATASAEGCDYSDTSTPISIDLKHVGDANGDGVVTIEDITSLIDKYLNQ